MRSETLKAKFQRQFGEIRGRYVAACMLAAILGACDLVPVGGYTLSATADNGEYVDIWTFNDKAECLRVAADANALEGGLPHVCIKR